MVRLIGFLRVIVVIALDYLAVVAVFHNPAVAGGIAAVIGIYSWFGGHIALLKEGAVPVGKLPTFDRDRLESAKRQLVDDVKSKDGLDITALKLYLVPGDGLHATAYGNNSVSVSRGTLDNADPVSLNGVLAHEVSHILHLDPEFSRTVFASVTLVVASLSVFSFATMLVVFLVFVVLDCFKSWLGLLAFRGTTKLTSGLIGLLQKLVVMIYQTVLSLVNRSTEYRCDEYAASLGYGIQLAHFLAFAAPETARSLTLTEALYRSHPPTEKRIYRLEEYVRKKMPAE